MMEDESFRTLVENGTLQDAVEVVKFQI